MAIAEKLAYLEGTKQAIKDAIVEKGTDVPEDTTFRAYADKVREIKSGSTNEQLDVTSNGTYTAPEGVGYSPVVVNVPQDGAPTAEELTVTGYCATRFAYGGWDWVVNKYGNQITTKDITNCQNMFNQARGITNIPFVINGAKDLEIPANSMFSSCSTHNIPKFNNFRVKDMGSMFNGCSNLKYFPEHFEEGFDFSYVDNITDSNYYGSQGGMFSDCYSLRQLPYEFMKHGNPTINIWNHFYNFSNCWSLDEIVNLPNPYYNAEWTENAFDYSFYGCQHLKDLTFAPTMTNGQPNSPKWSNQIIDLSMSVGTFEYSETAIGRGFSYDKQIWGDATYQQFKNDPDAWTTYQEYSRYNHDSAVRTINSLPDTSAFIASNGGTNTIKFAGANGSKTDGGAISTLTPEEIAVATAKGWTVEIV